MSIRADRRMVYVAGAYSADNVLHVLDNMRLGIACSAKLLQVGFSPFCPWADHVFYFVAPANSIPLESIYQYSLDYCLACASVFVVDNPRNSGSGGLKKELEAAYCSGKPVFWENANGFTTLQNWATAA